MPHFGKKSKMELATCDPRIQKILNYLIKYYDCSVICGYRGEYEQNEAYDSGNSKLRYPHGKHNKIPSMAVDVTPYPIPPKDDVEQYYFFAGLVTGIAISMGIKIRWGGDFNRDGRFSNEKFKDLWHFEIDE